VKHYKARFVARDLPRSMALVTRTFAPVTTMASIRFS